MITVIKYYDQYGIVKTQTVKNADNAIDIVKVNATKHALTKGYDDITIDNQNIKLRISIKYYYEKLFNYQLAVYTRQYIAMVTEYLDGELLEKYRVNLDSRRIIIRSYPGYSSFYYTPLCNIL